jgi:hypothetical protein
MAEEEDKDTILQIPISYEELKQRLELTKAYSELHKKEEELLNCANLVLVLLGLVTEPENYLLKCYDRSALTQEYELNTIVVEAFQKAEITYKGEAYTNLFEHAKFLEITEENTYEKVLKDIQKYMSQNHGTPLGITFEDGTMHLVLLYKGFFAARLIDPQLVTKLGFYPLTNIFFIKNPFIKNIKNIIVFAGPILPESKKALAKSTLSENIMHLNKPKKQGGKRKTRRQRRTKKTIR